MWIRNNNPATSRVYGEWMKEHVDDPEDELPGDGRGVCFDGPVQLREPVGETLIEQYASIEEHEAEDQ